MNQLSDTIIALGALSMRHSSFSTVIGKVTVDSLFGSGPPHTPRESRVLASISVTSTSVLPAGVVTSE